MKQKYMAFTGALALAISIPVSAQMTGNVQARYMFNDIDKISRDVPVGDNTVNKTKSEVSGFFANGEYPGWFVGFYTGHEVNYTLSSETVGPNVFQNRAVESTNAVNEIYFGKTHFGEFGEVSAELMVGTESGRDGLKYRPKVSGRYEFANGTSIFGYGMVLFQTYDGPRQSVAIDREFVETELQPGIGYKIDEHMGVWANYRLRDRTQSRAMFGNMSESERFLELGLWKNFDEVYTSLRLRTGNFQMWDPVSIIRNDDIYKLVGEVSLPLARNLRGIVDAGYMWENYGVVRSGAANHLRAPIVYLGLKYDL